MENKLVIKLCQYCSKPFRTQNMNMHLTICDKITEFYQIRDNKIEEVQEELEVREENEIPRIDEIAHEYVEEILRKSILNYSQHLNSEKALETKRQESQNNSFIQNDQSQDVSQFEEQIEKVVPLKNFNKQSNQRIRSAISIKNLEINPYRNNYLGIHSIQFDNLSRQPLNQNLQTQSKDKLNHSALYDKYFLNLSQKVPRTIMSAKYRPQSTKNIRPQTGIKISKPQIQKPEIYIAKIEAMKGASKTIPPKNFNFYELSKPKSSVSIPSLRPYNKYIERNKNVHSENLSSQYQPKTLFKQTFANTRLVMEGAHIIKGRIMSASIKYR